MPAIWCAACTCWPRTSRRATANLKIRQSDAAKFEVGRNLAVTPGKVVFQNDLMQLIQYAPTTESVLAVPLLIVPPWINKFYILDLTPEKSFIKWCVDQGLTVFVLSWVNPDARLADKGFEDYMREGPLAALDAIKQATDEDKAHIIGYCVGGTLMAVTLAYMAAKGDDRVLSATFFASQVDFTYAGDLKVFVDEEQIQAVERKMAERGYLEGSQMATAFNMLRSNDLVWPYIIGNYLKGQPPTSFDLLYWNSDSTRMPAANHSFYLRNCYLDNKLSKGEMVVAGETLDLGKITVPIYNLATREDHIAPAKSAFLGSKFFGGPVKFVLAGSGHIAGVVNPPGKAEISILERRAAGRKSRRLDRPRRGAPRVVVAGLGRMDQGPGCRDRPGAQAGRRQAQADRGRAGKLREGEGLRPAAARVACASARVKAG